MNNNQLFQKLTRKKEEVAVLVRVRQSSNKEAYNLLNEGEITPKDIMVFRGKTYVHDTEGSFVAGIKFQLRKEKKQVNGQVHKTFRSYCASIQEYQDIPEGTVISGRENLPRVDCNVYMNPVFGEVTIKWTESVDETPKSMQDIKSNMIRALKGDLAKAESMDWSILSFQREAGKRIFVMKSVAGFKEQFQLYAAKPLTGQDKAKKRLSSIVDCNIHSCYMNPTVVVSHENIDGLSETSTDTFMSVCKNMLDAGAMSDFKYESFRRAYYAGELVNTRCNYRLIQNGKSVKGDVRLVSPERMEMGKIVVYGGINFCPEIEVLDKSICLAFFRIGQSDERASVSAPLMAFANGIMDLIEFAYLSEKTGIQAKIRSNSFVKDVGKGDENCQLLAELYERGLEEGFDNALIKIITKVYYSNVMDKKMEKHFGEVKFRVPGTFKVSPGPLTNYSEIPVEAEKFISKLPENSTATGKICKGLISGEELFLSKESLGIVSFSHGTQDFDDHNEVIPVEKIGEEYWDDTEYGIYRCLVFRWPVGWREIRLYDIAIPEDRNPLCYPSVGLKVRPYDPGDLLEDGTLVPDSYSSLFPSTEEGAKKMSFLTHKLPIESVMAHKPVSGLIGNFYDLLVISICLHESGDLKPEVQAIVDSIMSTPTSEVVDAEKNGGGQLYHKIKALCTQARFKLVGEVPAFFKTRAGGMKGITFYADDLSARLKVMEEDWATTSSSIRREALDGLKTVRETVGTNSRKMSKRAETIKKKWGQLWRSSMAVGEMCEEASSSAEQDVRSQAMYKEMGSHTDQNSKKVVFDEMKMTLKNLGKMPKEYRSSVTWEILCNFIMTYGEASVSRETGEAFTDQDGNIKTENAMLSLIFTQDFMKLAVEVIEDLFFGKDPSVLKAKFFDGRVAEVGTEYYDTLTELASKLGKYNSSVDAEYRIPFEIDTYPSINFVDGEMTLREFGGLFLAVEGTKVNDVAASLAEVMA